MHLIELIALLEQEKIARGNVELGHAAVVVVSADGEKVEVLVGFSKARERGPQLVKENVIDVTGMTAEQVQEVRAEYPEATFFHGEALDFAPRQAQQQAIQLDAADQATEHRTLYPDGCGDPGCAICADLSKRNPTGVASSAETEQLVNVEAIAAANEKAACAKEAAEAEQPESLQE